MSILMTVLLAMASWNAGTQGCAQGTPASVHSQEGGGSAAVGTERVVIQKDGGPGHGPDQPFSVREQGARDLEGFIGGKYVIIEGPWDFLAFLLIVVLVVVLIIIL